MADIDVQFTDDIPKIERTGFGERSSKYDDLLNACINNELRAAKIDVDSQGAASSRATSIKTAASKHEAEQNDEGVFIVATRSGEEEDEFYVYTMFAPKGSEQYDDEVESRDRRAESARKRQATKSAKASGNGDETPKPKAKAKKVARKKS